MKIIYSTNGIPIQVSASDYTFLIQLRWHYSKTRGYCRCNSVRFWQGSPTYGKPLHWFVMKLNGLDCPKDKTIDHIDRDTTNNTHNNLRFATLQQQKWNQGIYKNNTSGFRGVCLHPMGYHVIIDGKHIGYYNTALKASQAYEKERAKREFDPPWSELKLIQCSDLEIKHTSEHPGVCYNKLKKKWIVRKQIKGKRHYFGCFNTVEEASQALGVGIHE